MKKSFGKEKGSDAVKGPEEMKSFAEGGEATKEEVSEFIKEEKTLISQCDSALSQLTNGLKDGSLPFFVRPVAKMLIENLKRIKGKAEGRLKELDASLKEAGDVAKEGVSAEAAPKESFAKEASVKEAENATKEGVAKEGAAKEAGEGAKESPNGGKSAKEEPAPPKEEKRNPNKPESVADMKEWLKSAFNGDNPVCSSLNALTARRT